MEDILTQAIKSRVPMIAVKTDDIIFVKEILEWIAGEDVARFDFPESAEFNPSMEAPPENVLYTFKPKTAYPRAWKWLKKHNKTLLYVNMEKSSVIYFQGGILLPPPAMVLAYLKHQVGDDAVATNIATGYGGLTLKDTYELTKITDRRVGQSEVMTPADINQTRGAYIAKLKGITQIDTTQEFYVAPKYLTKWVNENASFFVHPVDPALTPRGLLFDGPPGTGKTAGAKFLAKAMNIPLYRMDVAGMKGKYVGDSEGNLAAALNQIDQVAPCVVIMDELEKLFATTMSNGDSGVTSGMLATMLWWMQEHQSQVFLVATTNDKAKLPPELIRPGRIDDVMLFTGIQNPNEGLDFSKQVLEVYRKKTGLKTSDSILHPELKIRVGALYESDSKAVPQAKLEEDVKVLIKKWLKVEAYQEASMQPEPTQEAEPYEPNIAKELT